MIVCEVTTALANAAFQTFAVESAVPRQILAWVIRVDRPPEIGFKLFDNVLQRKPGLVDRPARVDSGPGHIRRCTVLVNIF